MHLPSGGGEKTHIYDRSMCVYRCILFSQKISTNMACSPFFYFNLFNNGEVFCSTRTLVLLLLQLSFIACLHACNMPYLIRFPSWALQLFLSIPNINTMKRHTELSVWIEMFKSNIDMWALVISTGMPSS